MGRTFVMGDIHGAHKALVQCLERSKFDFDNDTLIQLGDVCDGWSEVAECIDELLKIKNLIAIKGNHDDWFYWWLKRGHHPVEWMQGGEGTLKSYTKRASKDYVTKMGAYISKLTFLDIPEDHRKFFDDQKLYYVDNQNRLFVHGGYDRYEAIDYFAATRPSELYWDRRLWNEAMSCKDKQKLRTVDNFKEIFIGHTAVTYWGKTDPIESGGVHNLDTGAGFKGKLTIMNVETKEYFQSDEVQVLYNTERGRN